MRRLSLLFALLLGCGCGCGTSEPPQAPPPTFDLLAWEYPGARPIARLDPVLIGTDKVGLEEIAAEPREATRIKAPALYAYDTSDSLEAVYAFYARKLKLDPEYKPGILVFEDQYFNSATKLSYPNQNSYPNLRASYTGLNGRQAVRTATLVGSGGPGFSVVVVLSRGASEGFTSIEVVVTESR